MRLTKSRIHRGALLLTMSILAVALYHSYTFWHASLEDWSTSTLRFWGERLPAGDAESADGATREIIAPMYAVGHLLNQLVYLTGYQATLQKPSGMSEVLTRGAIGLPVLFAIGVPMTLAWAPVYVLIRIVVWCVVVGTAYHILPALLIPLLARWPVYPMAFGILVHLKPYRETDLGNPMPKALPSEFESVLQHARIQKAIERVMRQIQQVHTQTRSLGAAATPLAAASRPRRASKRNGST